VAMRVLRFMRNQNLRGKCQADSSGSGSKLFFSSPHSPPWHSPGFENSKAMDARQLWAHGGAECPEPLRRPMIAVMPQGSRTRLTGLRMAARLWSRRRCGW